MPIADGVAAVAASGGDETRTGHAGTPTALELAVSRGEDYELLATVPPERVREAGAAVAATGTALTRIGEAVAAPAAGPSDAEERVEIRLPDGRWLRSAGYDQLA